MLTTEKPLRRTREVLRVLGCTEQASLELHVDPPEAVPQESSSEDESELGAKWVKLASFRHARSVARCTWTISKLTSAIASVNRTIKLQSPPFHWQGTSWRISITWAHMRMARHGLASVNVDIDVERASGPPRTFWLDVPVELGDDGSQGGRRLVEGLARIHAPAIAAQEPFTVVAYLEGRHWPVRWSPSAHVHCPRDFRWLVCTLLVFNARPDRDSVLAWLPLEVLYTLIAHLYTASYVKEVRDVLLPYDWRVARSRSQPLWIFYWCKNRRTGQPCLSTWLRPTCT